MILNENIERVFQPPLWPVKEPFLRYVIKLHHASRLHFDFRLEVFGVLISWVFYEAPNPGPKVVHTGAMVEDQVLNGYLSELRIPEGQNGAGPLLVWDYGTYAPVLDHVGYDAKAVYTSLKDGELDFTLDGRRLKGKWRLKGTGKSWTLQKLPDEYSASETVQWDMLSVITGRELRDI